MPRPRRGSRLSGRASSRRWPGARGSWRTLRRACSRRLEQARQEAEQARQEAEQARQEIKPRNKRKIEEAEARAREAAAQVEEEQRRRSAAEQAVAEARSELEAVQSALESERGQRFSVEARSTELEEALANEQRGSAEAG